MYLIYGHKNKLNNKWYIGQTKNISSRFGIDGSAYLKKDNEKFKHPKFANAILKYGWNNFEHIILKENIETLEEANIYEKQFIKNYNSYKNGYNSNSGGNVSFTKTYKHSIKVVCIENNIEFNSAKEAAKLMDANQSGILNCCRNKQKTSGGFHWKFKDENNIIPRSKCAYSRCKKVICLNTGKIYDNPSDAAKDAGLKSKASIISCCNGKSYSAGMINNEPAKWQYLDNPKSKEINYKYICLETRKKYISINEISRDLHIYKKTISDCINLRTVKGYTILSLDKYEELKDKDFSYIPKSRANYGKHNGLSRKIRCIDTGEIFDSISEAANKYGLDRTSISNMLCGRTKTSGGLKWAYDI